MTRDVASGNSNNSSGRSSLQCTQTDTYTYVSAQAKAVLPAHHPACLRFCIHMARHCHHRREDHAFATGFRRDAVNPGGWARDHAVACTGSCRHGTNTKPIRDRHETQGSTIFNTSIIIIKYNNNIPTHLKNETRKIAVRVSNHLPLKTLLKDFSGFMVSTSVNISGEQSINDINEIINYFEYDELAYYDESLGGNDKPSQIIDLESKAIIRA